MAKLLKKINLQKIRYCMLGINIIASLFIMMVISNASQVVCVFEKASEFLTTVKRLPADPTLSFNTTCILCACFFATFFVRQVLFVGNRTMVYSTLIIDALLNAAMLVVMDYNYDGFLLWLLASIIYYIEGNWKYPVMIVGIFTYMFFSFDLMSVFNPLFSVRDYIAVYSGRLQLVLFILLYTFTALNLFTFVLYCIQMIREQKDTIDEINRLYKKLSKANDELREYADIKEKMGETKERNRLAMEIHDTIGHSLTGISVGVDTCIAIMDANPVAAKKQLQVISGVAKTGIADIRRSVSTLQNDMPKHTTLEQNIRDMIAKTQNVTGTRISFNTMTELHFEDDEENAVFRVIQESVTNAIRHGHAQKIDIAISKKEDMLKIIIADNGKGCDTFVSGFGTTHMRERVAMLNGTIDFISHNGFTVVADIPLRQEEEHD